MKFEHPHVLNKEEARRRVEALSNFWRDRYGVKVCWNGDQASLTGKVKGIDFDARLTVNDKCVEAEGTDPGFLMRAMATAYFKGKLAEYLDPSTRVEDLSQA